MKATILDIASASGLSTATVDRVLNNRAGVSATNRQRVLDAARQLGYLAVTDQVALPSKPAHLEFLIPGGSNTFMDNLVHNIEDFSSRLPLVASCKIHRLQDISPNEMLNAIEKISLRTSAVGVIAPDHPKTRNAMRELSEAGVRLVTIASDIPSVPRASYIGIDNRVAGRTAALLMGRLSAHRKGKVALFIGSRSYRGHEEREMGFRSVITEDFPHLSVGQPIEINDEPEASYGAASSLLTDPGDLVGIYCVGAGRSGIVRALKSAKLQAKPLFICHDLTEETRRYLLDELVDAVIDQNARLMAEQSVIGMLGTLASAAPYLTRKFIEPRIILRENIPVI
ncbi:LacI family transcriptional regulator [Rhizobium sp. AC44/96]|uniref:LacI family DNA-binding transcriptional regulator n=1 Tax=Rhizobium sp. AC44/96 TaxID=1841654 RepID=UPI00080FB726|nr:LacI family DNA-binding transcriptional regulator [Rhizobium sp. AC44/96]OCJ14453.1 LacI family transcriptional regulator [Rhizobium sp. AC44/96]